MSTTQPRRNRVDPFGDLHARPERGWFTGNRGCLVDENRYLRRHHRGNLWIVCSLRYKDWRSPLDQPGHWTPLFFLDEAVALAAGHRPCGLCRRPSYDAYRQGVARYLEADTPPSAYQLNRMLAAERLAPGRGLDRARDRLTWSAELCSLPDGTVVLSADRQPMLVWSEALYGFDFAGWRHADIGDEGRVEVLTPPTTVGALSNGYVPVVRLAGATRSGLSRR